VGITGSLKSSSLGDDPRRLIDHCVHRLGVEAGSRTAS
jgi:hypothetical protein